MRDREPDSEETLLQGGLAFLLEPANSTVSRGRGRATTLRDESALRGRMAMPPAPPLRLVETRVAGSRSSARPLRSIPAEEAMERFLPQEKIATGGMGVLRRYHDTVLGRDVVAKEIRPDQRDSDEARQRFLREAQIQANLQHPCIVPVYDVGNPSTADMFFTMAHVAGTTLRDVIAELRAGNPEMARRFSRRALLDAFCRVCLAVEYAHERGVVHRDLKPENIMLGDYGEVWVLDWGIAKRDASGDRRSSGITSTLRPLPSFLPRVYDEDPDGPSSLTDAGATLGTMEYLAPEQYVATGRLDGRTDVYALGAMLYEILSSKWFRDAKGRAELVRLVWQETFAPIARPPIEGVSPELNAVWQKATSTRREERYASARELHDAITGHLDEERDRERARESAMRLAREAALEIDRAGEAESDAEQRRERALRSLGRAIATDPSQAEALEALVNSLLEHPADAVPAVRRQVLAIERVTALRQFRLNVVVYLVWFLSLVLGDRLLGVLNRPAMALMGAVVLGLLVYNAWLARQQRYARFHMLVLMPLTFIAAGVLSLFLGPLVLVPVVASTTFAMFATTARSDKNMRALGMGLSLGVVIVPAMLQRAGLLPASYLYEEGRIVILPQLVALPPEVMALLMPAIGVLTVLFANLGVIEVVAALSRSEQAALTQVHRLRQLLPGRGSLAPPSA